MKWYAATRYSNDITERELTRVTDASVFFMSNGKERREARSSDYHTWFATKREAAQNVIAYYDQEAERHRRRVKYFEGLAVAAKAKHAAILGETA